MVVSKNVTFFVDENNLSLFRNIVFRWMRVVATHCMKNCRNTVQTSLKEKTKNGNDSVGLAAKRKASALNFKQCLNES